jgi:hypothetical protein
VFVHVTVMNASEDDVPPSDSSTDTFEWNASADASVRNASADVSARIAFRYVSVCVRNAYQGRV